MTRFLRITRQAASRLRGRLVALLIVPALVAMAPPAYGHNGETPPPPPQPPVDYALEVVYPPRWSWLHWWEANREPYLMVTRQIGAVQKPDQRVEDGRRQRAIEALQVGLKSERADVRAWSAQSLGKFGDSALHEVLATQLLSEKDNTARCLLLIGLGLLDGGDAERSLLGTAPASQEQRYAALAALGLLTRPAPATVEAMQATLRDPDAGMSTLAAWCLEHQPGDSARALVGALASTDSPWLASSAILAIGHQHQPDAIPMLADILLANEAGMRLHVMVVLKKRNDDNKLMLEQAQRSRADYMAQYQQYMQNVNAYNHNNPNRQFHPGVPVPQTGRIVLGDEVVAMAQVRAAAAIALGNFEDDRARAALAQAIGARDPSFWKGYSDLYKGPAIIALGQIGDAPAARLLADIVARKGQALLRRQEDLKSPLRGYAAIALGLYGRPATNRNTPDRPGYVEACRILGEQFCDPEETPEVRCACAMALGITGRGENLKYLQAGFDNLRRDDELIRGWAILARGMLHDMNIIEPAALLLAQDQKKPDMSGILARRAAVLGLGVLGSEQAIPILCKAWDLNYWVNREVAYSFAFLKATTVTEEMVRAINVGKDMGAKAYFARCLGEIYTAQRPARISLFTVGSNYTIKNLKLVPFQSLSNEFLYGYLIPAFGAQWR